MMITKGTQDTREHRCAVCDARVRAPYLMCTPHWRRVPEMLRRDVLRTWRAWNGSPPTDLRRQLARAYQKAVQAAVDYVEQSASKTINEPGSTDHAHNT